MSNLVNHLLCPNYEDYDPYDCKGNAYAGFPDMWEPEIRAEAGVYEERKKFQEQVFFMARDSVQRTIMHFKRMKTNPSYISSIAEKALLQLAEEYGWKVKNADTMNYFGVQPIIRTSKHKDEDTDMDVDIEVFINAKHKKEMSERELLLASMTKRERIHFEGKQQFPDKDKKNVVAYALVELAAENGWQSRKGTYPNGYRETFRI